MLLMQLIMMITANDNYWCFSFSVYRNPIHVSLFPKTSLFTLKGGK